MVGCIAGTTENRALTEKPSESAMSLGWAALSAMMAKNGSAVVIPVGQPSLGEGPQVLCRSGVEGKYGAPKAEPSFFPPLLCPTVTPCIFPNPHLKPIISYIPLRTSPFRSD